MKIPFSKMHGLGNDFVVIDCRSESYGIEEHHVRAIADRRLGVGCDQILFLVNPENSEANTGYKIVNRDGSPAEQCGNGLRCVVEYLRRKDQVKTGALVEVGEELIEAYICENGHITVKIAPPDFSSQSVSLTVPKRGNYYVHELFGEKFHFGMVSMGNPHAVTKISLTEEAQIEKIGASVQSSGAFLNGINVGFMEIISETLINLRVYERGVGETPACGTGACAAVVIGILWGDLLPGKVDVNFPGGALNVEWDGKLTSKVLMTGPAQLVFEGVVVL